jgi:hypothetical protein
MCNKKQSPKLQQILGLRPKFSPSKINKKLND